MRIGHGIKEGASKIWNGFGLVFSNYLGKKRKFDQQGGDMEVSLSICDGFPLESLVQQKGWSNVPKINVRYHGYLRIKGSHVNMLGFIGIYI